jgi:hypothetical protein
MHRQRHTRVNWDLLKEHIGGCFAVDLLLGKE